MKFEDYSPEVQAKLMEIGNAAADAVESQESPAEGIPEDSPNFSPELEPVSYTHLTLPTT